MAAVESGRLDAAVMTAGDHLLLLERHPGLRILVDCSTAEGARECFGGEAYAGGSLAAKREWLAENAESARRVARALARTHAWIAAHHAEEIREVLPDSFRTSDIQQDLKRIDWMREKYTRAGEMPPGVPETARRYLDAILPVVRGAKVDLASTWTAEFLEEGK